jgi:hypothetical protein
MTAPHALFYLTLGIFLGVLFRMTVDYLTRKEPAATGVPDPAPAPRSRKRYRMGPIRINAHRVRFIREGEGGPMWTCLACGATCACLLDFHSVQYCQDPHTPLP